MFIQFINSNPFSKTIVGTSTNIFTKINNQLLEEFYDKQISYESTSSAILLFAYKENSRIRVRIFNLVLSPASLETADSKYLEIIECLDYSQAHFHNNNYYKYLYYITYNDINNFYSGFTRSQDACDSQDTPKKNKAEFQFFEDVEIQEIKFLPNSRFFYYKLKIKGTSETKYFGIYDIDLNKVIFNTDEKLKYFLPHSNNAMLAVTDNEVYLICLFKNNGQLLIIVIMEIIIQMLKATSVAPQIVQKGK